MLKADVAELGDANFYENFWDFGVFVYYEDDNHLNHFTNLSESLGRWIVDVEQIIEGQEEQKERFIPVSYKESAFNDLSEPVTLTSTEQIENAFLPRPSHSLNRGLRLFRSHQV